MGKKDDLFEVKPVCSKCGNDKLIPIPTGREMKSEPILTKKQAIEMVKEFNEELEYLKNDDITIVGGDVKIIRDFLINHFKIEEDEIDGN